MRTHLKIKYGITIIKGEHTMPKEFAEQLALMHEVLDDTVEFRKEHNFNSFSYEIID